jgi:hypothetical protein
MKQDNDRKQKLIDLSADALADALLTLAVHFDEADDLIVDYASRCADKDKIVDIILKVNQKIKR